MYFHDQSTGVLLKSSRDYFGLLFNYVSLLAYLSRLFLDHLSTSIHVHYLSHFPLLFNFSSPFLNGFTGKVGQVKGNCGSSQSWCCKSRLEVKEEIKGQDGFNCWSSLNLDPPPKHDNSHTLSVQYVTIFQYGTDSVCELSCIGGGSRIKVDQQLNTSLEIRCFGWIFSVFLADTSL